ncbi:MAG: CsbD family protein, partial [Mesorhizobium sp.]
MVNKDQVAGVAKQAKGSVKQTAGKATGNRRTEAEGDVDKATGKMQKAYGD